MPLNNHLFKTIIQGLLCFIFNATYWRKLKYLLYFLSNNRKSVSGRWGPEPELDMLSGPLPAWQVAVGSVTRDAGCRLTILAFASVLLNAEGTPVITVIKMSVLRLNINSIKWQRAVLNGPEICKFSANMSDLNDTTIINVFISLCCEPFYYQSWFLWCSLMFSWLSYLSCCSFLTNTHRRDRHEIRTSRYRFVLIHVHLQLQ